MDLKLFLILKGLCIYQTTDRSKMSHFVSATAIYSRSVMAIVEFR